MDESARKIGDTKRMDNSKLSNAVGVILRVIVVLIAVSVIAVIVGELIGHRFVYNTLSYVVDELTKRWGVSVFLVKGIVLVVTIPFFWAVGKFIHSPIELLHLSRGLRLYRTKYGIIIVAYFALFYFAMYFVSIDAYAYKFCAETHEGIWTADSTGQVDPIYGIEATHCSPEQIMELRSGKGKLPSPHEIQIVDVNGQAWFNGASGRPKVWYDILPNGEYRFFDRPGRDPNTGEPLHEITPEVVQRLRERQALQESTKKEKAATQEAREVRSREVADLQTLAEQAEKQFASGDYKGAKETCDQVLRREKGSETCKTVRQHANVKIAQQLVAYGQTQLQRGKFDEALWNAEEAIKLDPTNPNAPKLKQFALQMKPDAVN